MFPQCLSNLYNQWFGPFFENADSHKIKVKISQHYYQNYSSIGEHEKKGMFTIGNLAVVKQNVHN